MKTLHVLLSCLLIVGCTIGNGHICGPQTPAAYCDKEAYEYLMYPKPYGAHWIKEGMTRETHLSDWIQCGGSADLDDGVEAKSGMTNKEFYDGLRTHRAHIRSCMGSRGYVWIETCDQRCL
jgi:hypothetical protein